MLTTAVDPGQLLSFSLSLFPRNQAAAAAASEKDRRGEEDRGVTGKKKNPDGAGVRFRGVEKNEAEVSEGPVDAKVRSSGHPEADSTPAPRRIAAETTTSVGLSVRSLPRRLGQPRPARLRAELEGRGRGDPGFFLLTPSPGHFVAVRRPGDPDLIACTPTSKVLSSGKERTATKRSGATESPTC